MTNPSNQESDNMTPEEQLRQKLHRAIYGHLDIKPSQAEPLIEPVIDLFRTTILSSKPVKNISVDETGLDRDLDGYDNGYNAGIDAAFTAITEALGGSNVGC